MKIYMSFDFRKIIPIIPPNMSGLRQVWLRFACFLLLSFSVLPNTKAEWVSYMIPMNPVAETFECLENLNFQIAFEYNNEADVSETLGSARFYDSAIRNFHITSPDFGGVEPEFNVTVGSVVLDLGGFTITRLIIFGGNVSVEGFEECGDVSLGTGSRLDFSNGWIGQDFEFLDSFALEFTYLTEHLILPALSKFSPIHSKFAIKPSSSSDIVSWLQGCTTFLGAVDIPPVGPIDNDLGADCYDSSLKLPTELFASQGVYSDNIEVTWSAVEGAEYYAIYRSYCGSVPLPAGSNLILGPGNHRFQPPDHEPWRIATVDAATLSYEDFDIGGNDLCNLGLEALGLNFHYWVRAIRGGCLGQFPAIPQASGYPIANPPHSLRATKGDFNDKVRLSWQISRGTTGFRVYRGLTDDFLSAQPLQTFSGVVEGEENAERSWEDDNVDPNIEHFYWVETFYRGGRSSTWSLGVTDGASGYAGDLNPNLPPTNVELTNDRIAENNGPGTPIGDFIVTDPNEDDTHTFELISVGGGPRSSFSVTDHSLFLNTDLDFETVSQYTVKILVQDAGGLAFEKDVIIYVDDMDEPDPVAGDPPRIIKNLSSRLIGILGGSITFEVVATGALPMQFLWYKNGRLIGNGDGPKFSLNPVRSNHGGKYHVRVINEAGEASSAQVNLFVLDTSNGGSGNQAPVIGLHGSPLIYLEVNGIYEEPGYTALDLEDGEITQQVQISESINISQPGTYTVRYAVRDSQGLNAEAKRAVIVKEQPPVSNADRQIARILDERQVDLFVAPEVVTQSYAVKEFLPQGFVVSDISHGGVWQPASHTIEWGPFGDNEPRTLSYQFQEPDDFSGEVEIFGFANVDGSQVVADGDSSVESKILAEGQNSVSTRVITQQQDEARIEVTVSPETSILVYAVEETLPSGFTASSISENGVIDTVNQKIKWGPYFDNQTRTFEYTLSPPATYAGSVVIAGYVSVDGQDVSTQGDSALVFTGEPDSSVGERSVSQSDGHVEVSLSVKPDIGTVAYAVEETLPAGFSAALISGGGSIDAVNNKIKWGPFFDANPRTLTYELTSPGGISGKVNLTGFVSLDGQDFTVGGDLSFEIGGQEPVGLSIATQPIGGEVALGESFAFSVSAAGSVQGYQWFKDGQMLSGATLPFLLLPAVSADDFGAYHVVVTGQGGSITSDAVQLSPLQPPVDGPLIDPKSITFLKIGNLRQMALSVSSQPGKSYQVIIKSNLNSLAWNPVGPIQTANGESIIFLIDITQREMGFFQVVEK